MSLIANQVEVSFVWVDTPDGEPPVGKKQLIASLVDSETPYKVIKGTADFVVGLSVLNPNNIGDPKARIHDVNFHSPVAGIVEGITLREPIEIEPGTGDSKAVIIDFKFSTVITPGSRMTGKIELLIDEVSDG